MHIKFRCDANRAVKNAGLTWILESAQKLRILLVHSIEKSGYGLDQILAVQIELTIVIAVFANKPRRRLDDLPD